MIGSSYAFLACFLCLCLDSPLPRLWKVCGEREREEEQEEEEEVVVVMVVEQHEGFIRGALHSKREMPRID